MKLRTLSSAFLGVFFCAPLFAQTTLNGTSGFGSFGPDQFGPEPDGGGSFGIAGPGFSYGGDINAAVLLGDPFPFAPYSPGPPPSQIFYNANSSIAPGGDDNLMAGLVVNGVTFAYNPQDLISGSEVLFSMGPVEFSGPGTFYSPFTMFGTFTGAPANVLAANPEVCAQMLPACTTFDIQGSGIATYDVVPWAPFGAPGALFINGISLTYTPEPPTVALLLLGVAGLGVLGLRRRSGVTMLPAG